MFCTHCGTKNREDSRFCVSCGNPFQQQPPADVPPPVFQRPPDLPPQLPPLPPWPPLPSGTIPEHRVRAKRMNKAMYMICAAGGFILSTLLMAWGATDSKVEELLYFAWLPLIPALIALYMMIYKMWAAIQDGHARTSPGKAVGFMFIPLFNIYWFVQVFYGWAKDYNSFLVRHQLNAPKVSENTFLTYVISSFFCFPVSIVMFFIVISRICNAVNALTIYSRS